jgi:hypothetical protein
MDNVTYYNIRSIDGGAYSANALQNVLLAFFVGFAMYFSNAWFRDAVNSFFRGLDITVGATRKGIIDGFTGLGGGSPMYFDSPYSAGQSSGLVLEGFESEKEYGTPVMTTDSGNGSDGTTTTELQPQSGQLLSVGKSVLSMNNAHALRNIDMRDTHRLQKNYFGNLNRSLGNNLTADEEKRYGAFVKKVNESFTESRAPTNRAPTNRAPMNRASNSSAQRRTRGVLRENAAGDKPSTTSTPSQISDVVTNGMNNLSFLLAGASSDALNDNLKRLTNTVNPTAVVAPTAQLTIDPTINMKITSATNPSPISSNTSPPNTLSPQNELPADADLVDYYFTEYTPNSALGSENSGLDAALMVSAGSCSLANKKRAWCNAKKDGRLPATCNFMSNYTNCKKQWDEDTFYANEMAATGASGSTKLLGSF